MNIEKIRNYNQKIIAVICTAVVAMALIGLIILLVNLIRYLIPSGTNPDVLLSDEKVDQLKKDSLRQQIISYNSPVLVDTSSLIYLIPVNVKTLRKPEEIGKEVMMDTKLSDLGSTDYNTKYYYDSFNNLLLYYYPSGETTRICKQRMIGADLTYMYFSDDIIIAFTGAEEDTDKDDKITLSDLRTLYLYSLKKGVLTQVKYPHSTIESYSFVHGKKDILITFGYDRDENNIFESGTEPTFLMKYDYSTDKLLAVIDRSKEEELQDIIDKK